MTTLAYAADHGTHLAKASFPESQGLCCNSGLCMYQANSQYIGHDALLQWISKMRKDMTNQKGIIVLADIHCLGSLEELAAKRMDLLSRSDNTADNGTSVPDHIQTQEAGSGHHFLTREKVGVPVRCQVPRQ